MQINQIHLPTCVSTQDELIQRKERLTQGETLLISTGKQTGGHGRRGSPWLQTETGLAFSFNLIPQKNITLTPLELGILVCSFFEQHYQTELFLKWPNDIMNKEREKVGGILCQNSEEHLIAGIGLNLTSTLALEHLSQPCGGIFRELPEKDLSSLKSFIPYNFMNYFSQHRLSAEATIKDWEKYCLHLHEQVRIQESKDEFLGTFKGIDEFGRGVMAMKDATEKRVSAGSLFLLF